MKRLLGCYFTEKAIPILSVCLVMALAISTMHAQVATVALRVKVNNSFSINGKTYPAGQYEFRHENNSTPLLKMSINGSATTLKVIERLSADPSRKEGKVVFDKVGDSYYLSEVWIPGKDGFLVGISPGGNETHVTAKEEK